MKASLKTIKTIEIEEFFTEDLGKVYWHYRFPGGEWNQVLTPYKEIPVLVTAVTEPKANVPPLMKGDNE